MKNVTLVSFLSAAVFAAIALIPVWKYPITRKYLEDLRNKSTLDNKTK